MRPFAESEADEYEFDDVGSCPWCGEWFAELADDAELGTGEPDEDVTSAKCPSCGNRFAIVVTHSYHITKFKGDVDARASVSPGAAGEGRG